MLNAEKNKKKILDITESGYYFAVSRDGQNIVRSCDGLKCENCIFDEGYKYDCGCNYSRMKWLLSEYKEPHVKLTRLEYLLLKLFYEKDFRYLTRGVKGYLYIHKGNNPPRKKDAMWLSYETYISFDLIDDLFQFVKWSDEEPTSIQEVLENCEVVEDAEE